MIHIKVTDMETGEDKELDTDGYLLLTLDKDNNVKMQGKLGIKALSPILTKIVLEKLVK